MRRRQFLKGTASAAAVLGLPSIVPSRVFGGTAPSDRINVALIGCGNQSRIDLPAFLNNEDVQVVAVCDVNTGSYGYNDPKYFLGREPALKQVNQFYADKTKSGKYDGCKAYANFLDIMLSRPDIDVVAVVVPDHWHSELTGLAVSHGKDVYCEKPLTLTVDQGKGMIKGVREHKRILQTGSHWRSGPAVRHACELVRNGRIGQLQRIQVYLPKNNFVGPGPGWQPMPVPEGFDYNTWLGPAPIAPYYKDRCLYRFRFILDYSGGQVTNFGAHYFDIAQWGHGSDTTGPVEFEDAGAEFPEPGSLFTTATKVAFRARYADGVELVCQTSEKVGGTRFEGTEGWVHVDSKGVRTSPESLATSEIKPNEIQLPRSNPKRVESKYSNYLPDHVRNFLASVKSRQDPIEPVEVGHRTASICHLGNIAMQLKRKIRWDPEAEQIVGDDEANRMLSRPARMRC
ncbi:MAG TPA: Gfo/Idh/MocA family oxidoreductase [Pirellulales bacterium]|nr:Gfo/Idh/MocA family oxidoreductase [Pirellulales bacterium]